MNYEKKYNEALKRAKELYSQHCAEWRDEDIEYIFPELVESEDEKIRKWLINEIKIKHHNLDEENVDFVDKSIAWLEKQGENFVRWNENTDDNKPKKHHSVLMKTTHGIAEGEWQGVKWLQYRWSSRLKDSDVLFWIELSDIEKQGEQESITFNNAHIIDPALNDYCCKQYDALYKENGGVLSYARLQHLAMDIYGWCKGQIEQTAWSEEDEMFVHGLIRGLAAKRDIHGHTTFSSDCIDITETIDWLKSLRPQNKWKPSELQLECLSDAIEYYNSSGYPAPKLKELYEQLKKLKEE